ncbi:MAG: hypothetical protein WEA80_01855 [Gemmatimonadaceae bacterium]
MFASIEVIRMVAAIAKDPVYGVNAQIALLTMDGADARPPVLKAILNEADENVAIDEKPAVGWPIGAIVEDDDGIEAVPEAVVGYRQMVVGIAFVIVTDAAGGPLNWRRAKYTGQAFVNSMEKGLLAPGRLEVAGVRNGVQILQATSLNASSLDATIGQARFKGVVRYRFDVVHNL